MIKKLRQGLEGSVAARRSEAKNAGDFLTWSVSIAAAWCLLSTQNLVESQSIIQGKRCDGKPHPLQPLMPLLMLLASLNVFCREDVIMTEPPTNVSFVDHCSN